MLSHVPATGIPLASWERAPSAKVRAPLRPTPQRPHSTSSRSPSASAHHSRSRSSSTACRSRHASTSTSSRSGCGWLTSSACSEPPSPARAAQAGPAGTTAGHRARCTAPGHESRVPSARSPCIQAPRPLPMSVARHSPRQAEGGPPVRASLAGAHAPRPPRLAQRRAAPPLHATATVTPPAMSGPRGAASSEQGSRAPRAVVQPHGASPTQTQTPDKASGRRCARLSIDDGLRRPQVTARQHLVHAKPTPTPRVPDGVVPH